LQATVNPSELSLSSSIAPSESISQHSSNDMLSQASQPRKKARLEQSSWLWNMFKIVPQEDNTFIDPRTKKIKKEKEIYCQYLGCNWRILERLFSGASKRSTRITTAQDER
jgi:hypothetical protein